MSKEKTPIEENTVTISAEYFKELQQVAEGFREAIEEAYTACWGNDGGNESDKIEEAKQYYTDKYGK